jgi:hypothetical protein
LSDADKTNIDIQTIFSVDKQDPLVVEIVKSFTSLPVRSIVVNDPKLGCNQNTLQAISLAKVCEHSPFILHLEDDTVPTKDCLQFFMYAFNKYRNDSKIISVGGYNKTEEIDNELIYDTFSEPFFSAWGCGFWVEKLDIIFNHWTKSNSNHGMSWDSYLSHVLFEEKQYTQVRPIISRIQNIGAEKGTWVADPMWHYYNHRSPYLSNDFEGNIDWNNYAKNN